MRGGWVIGGSGIGLAVVDGFFDNLWWEKYGYFFDLAESQKRQPASQIMKIKIWWPMMVAIEKLDPP
jgi:hypothetical protein